MNYPLEDLYTEAVALATEAGHLLRQELHRAGGHRAQGEGALVDYEAEDLIRQRLMTSFPMTGFRSEERPEFNRAPEAGCTQTWLIDPHDGTTAAMQGQRGATVSLGLIDGDGRPCVGVVYAYAYPDDVGDMIAWRQGMPAVMRNGKPLDRTASPTMLVLVSRSADRRARAYGEAIHPYRYQPLPGIAYRLALAAVGDADLAISLGGPRDFDCAGGHALLIGAGLDLYDERGRPIRYHHDRPTAFGFCFGGEASACTRFAALDWTPVLSAPAETAPPLSMITSTHDLLTDQPDQLSRAQGAWLGQLCGDALGSQVEFQSPAEIARAWPKGVDRIVGGGPFNTIAGQPTDDSEMALVLARQLIADGQYDRNNIADAYRYWFESSPFDIGQTVRQSLSRLRLGGGTEEARANANRDSQANGALMRVIPIAIAGAARGAIWTSETAALDAALTHPHPVCIVSNQVFALAVRKAIVDGDGPEVIHRYALQCALDLDRTSPVVDVLRKSRTEGAPADMMTNMGWVLKSMQCAFGHLLSSKTPMAALTAVVGLGGDTDTNACIAGGLIGAVHGRTSWSPAWVRPVATCRPIETVPGVHRPRGKTFWPIDALALSEALLCLPGGQT
ncbi:MAG: inositol monophosphatase family protein [Myxococcota bacterium]|nr:inositol monophosphatase family protein [Myxococcota bacterium]